MNLFHNLMRVMESMIFWWGFFPLFNIWLMAYVGIVSLDFLFCSVRIAWYSSGPNFIQISAWTAHVHISQMNVKGLISTPEAKEIPDCWIIKFSPKNKVAGFNKSFVNENSLGSVQMCTSSTLWQRFRSCCMFFASLWPMSFQEPKESWNVSKLP